MHASTNDCPPFAGSSPETVACGCCFTTNDRNGFHHAAADERDTEIRRQRMIAKLAGAYLVVAAHRAIDDQTRFLDRYAGGPAVVPASHDGDQRVARSQREPLRRGGELRWLR